jgi:hypothetical protein
MSVYESAFSLETGASDERVERASEVLTDGAGIVVFDGFLALRRAGRQLLCEVIDPTPSAHRCANEYEVLVENARRALEASKLAARLPWRPRKWIVVEAHGTDTTEVWRAP